MNGFVVRVWCRDCGHGQDPLGCLGGGSELIHEDKEPWAAKVFATREEAEDAGLRYTSGPPWEFEVEEAGAEKDAKP